MVDRIKQVMEHYEETPAGFAEKIGVNRSNLTHVFTGRNQPSLDFAKKVLVAFPEVSTEWLIMGVGKMIKNPDEAVPVKKEFIQTELFGTEDELSTTNAFRAAAEPVTIGMEEPTQAPSVSIPLENVKPDVTVTSASDGVKNIDNEDVKLISQPSVTVSESNIPRQAVREVGKNDSQRVEKPQAEQTSSCPDQPNTEPSQVKSSEKTQTPKEKKIEKIIFFYDDDSFKVYHP